MVFGGRIRIYVVLTCLILLGIATTSYAVQRPREHTVVRTEQGFVPQKITIRKGDTVVFKNERTVSTWPASDYHPTHNIYSAFDPEMEIAPGASWGFTFDQAGVWTLHDHVDSQVRGTIIVEGYPGEAKMRCLEIFSQTPLEAAACWETDIVSALEDGGIDAAFAVFDTLWRSEPLFQASCHDVSHTLGKKAYEMYSADGEVIDRPQASFCGYGFYHGFIGSMLLAEGSMKYDAAISYCEQLRRVTGGWAGGSCFHGIGHATFDSLDGSYWGDANKMVQASLDVCRSAIKNKEDLVQCSTGVYNALGNSVGSAYDLSYDDVDLLELCLDQPQEFQYGCIMQSSIGYIRNKKMNREAALEFVQSLRPDLSKAGIISYIQNEVLQNMDTFSAEEYRDTCRSLRGGNPRHCIRGVVAAMENLGNPKDQYKPMFAFCETFSDSWRRVCFEDAAQIIVASKKSSSEFYNACQYIKDIGETDRLCQIPD